MAVTTPLNARGVVAYYEAAFKIAQVSDKSDPDRIATEKTIQQAIKLMEPRNADRAYNDAKARGFSEEQARTAGDRGLVKDETSTRNFVLRTLEPVRESIINRPETDEMSDDEDADVAEEIAREAEALQEFQEEAGDREAEELDQPDWVPPTAPLAKRITIVGY